MGAAQWYKVWVGASRHWKVDALTKVLGLEDRRLALAIEVLLWEYLAEHAPTGDLTRIPPEALAHVAGEDDAGRLMSALAEVGMTEVVDGKLLWHGWNEKNGGVGALRSSTERTRAYRERHRDVTGTPCDASPSPSPSISHSSSEREECEGREVTDPTSPLHAFLTPIHKTDHPKRARP